MPLVGPVLSAAGALISDLTRTLRVPVRTTDRAFAYDDVNAALEELERRCRDVHRGARERRRIASEIRFSVEARYPHQVWELEVPAAARPHLQPSLTSPSLCDRFHRKHRDVFAIADDDSMIEFESWHARARCRLATPALGTIAAGSRSTPSPRSRTIHVPGAGRGPGRRMAARPACRSTRRLAGPAIVQTPTTTVLADPGTHVPTAAKRDAADRPACRSERAADLTRREAEMDGVDLAVISSRLNAIVHSMMNTIFRSGRSGVLNSAHDFSCCIVSAEHELVMGAESLPVHMMSGPDLISRAISERAPGHAPRRRLPAQLALQRQLPCRRPLHVRACRRRRRQCTDSRCWPRHIRPTAATRADDLHARRRGRLRGGRAAVRRVQAQTDYTDNEDVLRLCRLRIRVPDQWWGDYLALLGAVRVGERRMLELGDELGWDVLDEFVAEWFDYSETAHGRSDREAAVRGRDRRIRPRPDRRRTRRRRRSR